MQAQGSFGPTPTVFYDLFRVADGKIANLEVGDKPGG